MKFALATVIASIITLTGSVASAQRTFIGLPYCQSAPAMSDMLRNSNHAALTIVHASTCASVPVGTSEAGLYDFGADYCSYDNANDLTWNDCHISCFIPGQQNLQWDMYYMSESYYGPVWNWIVYFNNEPGTDGRSYCSTEQYLVILN